MIGETVGSYRILKQLGEGGMGVVYLAEHQLIGRKVAIKVLRPEFSTRPAIMDRFFNEARATAVIKHPGLIDIFDFGYHPSGSAFIVMELLDGESLASRIARDGTIEPGLLIEISRQVALGLGAAHAQGIVHRDLKPDNVFLSPTIELPGGLRVKVLDFGIAKLTGELAYGQKTRTGAVLGTPSYMSPEQCRGASEVDHRSDVYSLGCMMFMMACGRPPFLEEGHGEVMAAHIRDPPPSPRSMNPMLPKALEGVILRALTKDREKRQQTMDEFVADLARCTSDRPARFPPIRRSSQSASTLEESAITSAGDSHRPRVSTTLAHSAAELLPASSRGPPGRRRLVVGALSVTAVLVGGGFAGMRWLSSSGDENGKEIGTQTRGPSASAPDAAISAHPATVASGTPVASPIPKVDPPTVIAAPLSSTVTLKIESEPAGADVVGATNSTRLGKTPLSIAVGRDSGPARFILSRPGYYNGSLTVETGRNGGSVVKLRRKAAGPDPVGTVGHQGVLEKL